MDTSETYLEMCKKAEEIQKVRPNPLQKADKVSWDEADSIFVLKPRIIGVGLGWHEQRGHITP